MRRTVYYCDKCGKEIPDMQLETVLIGGDTYDLCPDCYKALVDVVHKWLDGSLNKPALEPDEKVSGKKARDMGKVHALMNAGWSRDKIGVEFGVSGQTISNWLKAEEAFDGED